jgi:hypothetical protein
MGSMTATATKNNKYVPSREAMKARKDLEREAESTAKRLKSPGVTFEPEYEQMTEAELMECRDNCADLRLGVERARTALKAAWLQLDRRNCQLNMSRILSEVRIAQQQLDSARNAIGKLIGSEDR